jgi:hypothetical protein
MNGYTFWFGMLAGIFAIAIGLYSVLRTNSIASWLEGQGIQHSSAEAVFLRQVRTLGALFIFAGGFIVVVAIRNHYWTGPK